MKLLITKRLLTAAALMLGLAAGTARANKTMERAMSAVFGKKEIKKLKFNGHGFNVKPAKFTKSGGKLTIKGRISHRLRFRPDDQVDYTLVVNADGSFGEVTVKVKKHWLNKALSRAWKEIKKLIKEEIEKELGGGVTGMNTSALKKLSAAKQVEALEKALATVEKEIGTGGWQKEAAKIIANIMVRAEASRSGGQDKLKRLRRLASRKSTTNTKSRSTGRPRGNTRVPARRNFGSRKAGRR